MGLPTLTLQTADGSREVGKLPNFAEPALPTLGINDLLLGLDYILFI